MRVLVLGANGMLGHALCRRLARTNDVIGTCRAPHRATPWLRSLLPAERLRDTVALSEPRALAPLLERVHPDAVVNCAGVVRQRAPEADPATAIRVNSVLPHEVASLCDGVGARLITISTDCVFSGNRGKYREEDVVDPVDFYGRSKWLGEVTRDPHLTLRSSFIGRQLTGAEGLLEWFLAQRGKKVRGYSRAVFSGLTTDAFAAVVEQLLAKPGTTGLYHVASTPISKLDLLCALRGRLALDVEIEPDGTVVCDRSLDGSRLQRDTGVAVPGWERMLSDLAAASDL